MLRVQTQTREVIEAQRKERKREKDRKTRKTDAKVTTEEQSQYILDKSARYNNSL